MSELTTDTNIPIDHPANKPTSSTSSSFLTLCLSSSPNIKKKGNSQEIDSLQSHLDHNFENNKQVTQNISSIFVGDIIQYYHIQGCTDDPYWHRQAHVSTNKSKIINNIFFRICKTHCFFYFCRFYLLIQCLSCLPQTLNLTVD